MRSTLFVVTTTRWCSSRLRRARVKILAGLLPPSIDKNKSEFLAAASPGCACSTIPTFFSDSMSWKSSLQTTRNHVSN